MRSQLQSNVRGEGNCFFPVNEEKKKEEEHEEVEEESKNEEEESKEKEEHEEVEEEEEEEGEDITTTMQSSAAVLQSCTRGLRQLFLSSAQGGEGGREQNYNPVMQQSCTRQPR